MLEKREVRAVALDNNVSEADLAISRVRVAREHPLIDNVRHDELLSRLALNDLRARLACLHNRLAESVRIVRGPVHQRSVECLSGLHCVTPGIAVVLWRPMYIDHALPLQGFTG